MTKRIANITIFSAALLVASCKDTPSKNHGPIVLGDSSTIVTETDPRKLQDLVTDLKPEIPPAKNEDSITTVKNDTPKPDTTPKVKPAIAAQAPATTAQPAFAPGSGLVADFKDVSVLVTGLNGRQAGGRDLQHANGAVYTLTGGNVSAAQIRVKGNVTKVSQRYQTVVLLHSSDLGVIQLDAFSSTSDWEALKGGNNQYRVAGLDAGSLDHPDANNGSIRAAVTKAAKRRRMSHAKLEDLLDDVKKVRSLNQRPLSVSLRSVIWKIDGKDAQGRAFSKQVRVDLPI